MDSCEKEFESAGQEARRLAIALKRFTEVQDPVWKEKYQHHKQPEDLLLVQASPGQYSCNCRLPVPG